MGEVKKCNAPLRCVALLILLEESMSSDLPKHLLKISIALLKSPVKTWMGEEFYDSVGDALLAVGGEESQQKIDDFLLPVLSIAI